jgi:hypothetical protein
MNYLLHLRRSKYFSEQSIFKHLLIYILPSKKDPTSHPYNTTGMLITLYILIFNILESR